METVRVGRRTVAHALHSQWGATDLAMRRIALTLGILTTLGTTACDLEPPQEVTLRIDHFREPCPDGQPGYCLRVLESSEPGITHAREIAGFEHRWGTTYEVRALAAPSIGDVPSFDLMEVVSEDPVDTTERFSIELPPEFVQRVDATTFDLVGQTRATCATPEVCNAVVDALYEDTSVRVELSHDGHRVGSFVAHAAAIRGS